MVNNNVNNTALKVDYLLVSHTLLTSKDVYLTLTHYNLIDCFKYNGLHLIFVYYIIHHLTRMCIYVIL